MSVGGSRVVGRGACVAGEEPSSSGEAGLVTPEPGVGGKGGGNLVVKGGWGHGGTGSGLGRHLLPPPQLWQPHSRHVPEGKQEGTEASCLALCLCVWPGWRDCVT